MIPYLFNSTGEATLRGWVFKKENIIDFRIRLLRANPVPPPSRDGVSLKKWGTGLAHAWRDGVRLKKKISGTGLD